MLRGDLIKQGLEELVVAAVNDGHVDRRARKPSLCVIDSKPRNFADKNRQELAKLGKRVDERLAKLTESRRRARSLLLEEASVPALAELQEVLTPVRTSTEAGIVAAAALNSFQRLAEHLFRGGSSPPGAIEQSLSTAAKALEDCENALYDIESSLGDAEDSLLALKHLTSATHSTRLSEVLIAGQELARHAVRPVGGASLPDLSYDPQIYSPRALAVSLVAATLSTVAAELDKQGSTKGILIELKDGGSIAEVTLNTLGLPRKRWDESPRISGTSLVRSPPFLSTARKAICGWRFKSFVRRFEQPCSDLVLGRPGHRNHFQQSPTFAFRLRAKLNPRESFSSGFRLLPS